MNWKWKYCIQDYFMRILFYVMMLNLYAVVLQLLGQMACIRVSSSWILFVNPLYDRFPIVCVAYCMQIARVLLRRKKTTYYHQHVMIVSCIELCLMILLVTVSVPIEFKQPVTFILKPFSETPFSLKQNI